MPEVPGYDVGRRLGRGASATVWLVVEHSTGREYALKCFDRGSGDAAVEDGIRRELNILSVLDHDHLVHAHAVVRIPDGSGGLGLVLDYAPGGSLAELLAARGRLGAGETVTVLTPVAQALAYLHTHGFAHGDVSPGNVLFTAHGKPLLADLGVGRMMADVAEATEAGTAGFRDPAPTHAARAGLQPERDVFSAAAIGWFCLTGSAPGTARLRPPLSLVVPDIPPELAAALEAGLSEDWTRRPSASEFAAAIYRSAAAEPVDLSVSVHPEVIPRLLTRRAVPPSARERRAARIRGWLRTLRPARRPGPGGSAGRAAPARPAPRPVARHALPDAGASARRVSGRRRSRWIWSSGLAFLCSLVLLTGAWWLGGWRPAQPPDAAGIPAVSLPSPSGSPPGDPGHPTGTPAAPGTGTTATGTTGTGTTGTGTTGTGTTGPGATGPGATGPGTTGTAPPSAADPTEFRTLIRAADPATAVRGLAGLRSLALSSGDLRLLDEVNAPASGAAAADARISMQLSAEGHRLDGFRTSLTRVVATPGSDPSRAEVAVTAVTPPYREVDADGTVVAERPSLGELRLRLVLVRIDGAWRMSEIHAGEEVAGEHGTDTTG